MTKPCGECGAYASLLLEGQVDFERIVYAHDGPRSFKVQVAGEETPIASVTHTSRAVKDVCVKCALKLFENLKRSGDQVHMRVSWVEVEPEDA